MAKAFDISKFRKDITKSINGLGIGFNDPTDWPAEVNGSGKEGLAAQEAIEGAIKSFETNTVVEL